MPKRLCELLADLQAFVGMLHNHNDGHLLVVYAHARGKLLRGFHACTDTIVEAIEGVADVVQPREAKHARYSESRLRHHIQLKLV